MKRLGCGTLFLLGLFFAFFLGLLGQLAMLEPPFQLLFGWIASLWRYLHAWHAKPATVAFFLVAAAVLVSGTQMFSQWLYRSFQPSEGERAPRRWRWKWTLCGYGIVICALVAIACVVLTVHQVYWMSQSTEPWLENKTRRLTLLLATAYRLQNQAEQNNWDSASTRSAFWTNSSYDGMEWEQLEPIWVHKDEQTLRAIILVQRQRVSSYQKGFALLEPGRTVATHSLEDLNKTLASFGMETSTQPPEQRPVLQP